MNAGYKALLCCAVLGLLLGVAGARADDGYTVLAQAADGGLYAAVVQYTDTGARALLIGETQDGTVTQTACGEHVIPTDWAEDALTVEVYSAQSAEEEAMVTVRAETGVAGTNEFVSFRLVEDGWQFLAMWRWRSEAGYYVVFSADCWQTYVSDYDLNVFTVVPMPDIPAALAAFDYTDAVDTAAAAYAERVETEAAVFSEQWQAAFADTAWADAAVLARAYRYANGEIISVLAAARTEQALGIAVLTQTDAGDWDAAVNTTLFPPDTGAEDIELHYPDEDDEILGAPWFTLSDPCEEAGSPSVSFRRSEQGDWNALDFGFWESETEFWHADFEGGILRLYAGENLGEEGYLYRKLDSSLVRFETFDFQQMKNAMYELYDDFMAGEPPMIPDDGTAYALPQPCGAALKKGTYAVYTGPGREYYREANGKAAVSSKDWVQVFGTDGDWVLVQYRIDGPLLRFGYIETGALEDPDSVPALTLETVSLGVTENEFVTSNPLGKGGRIDLQGNTAMTRLGTLGDYWLYVELTLPNGKPARMFTEVIPSHG